jgi:putative ABC transport system permease protein
VNLVVGAAFVTLLMIVVNTMVFAVRERTFEIGVLKTLGFSRRGIMALILGETLFVFAMGGGLGLVLAKLATLIAGPALGLVLSLPVLAKALAIIAALGLATGALPAFNAMRTPIIKAFRTR